MLVYTDSVYECRRSLRAPRDDCANSTANSSVKNGRKLMRERTERQIMTSSSADVLDAARPFVIRKLEISYRCFLQRQMPSTVSKIRRAHRDARVANILCDCRRRCVRGSHAVSSRCCRKHSGSGDSPAKGTCWHGCDICHLLFFFFLRNSTV